MQLGEEWRAGRVMPSSEATGWARLRNRLRYAPDDPEALGFELASLAGSLIISLPFLGNILKMIGRAFGAVLQAMSLDVEANNSFSRDPWGFYWRICLYAVPITIFFCFGMNAIFSLRDGTFWPAPPPSGAESVVTISFFQDWYNWALYLVVCPIYVSSAICLLVTTALSWRTLNGYYQPDAQTRGFKISTATRVAGFITVSFLITGFYAAEYITDLANPGTTPALYWFFDWSRSGPRILNRTGDYYLFMNAVLLYLTSMAAFCYIAISIEMFRIGKNIRRSVFFVDEAAADLKADFEKVVSEKEAAIRRTLSDFSYSYVMAKLLVFTYAVNIIIWQVSPAGHVKNMNSAIVAVIIIGLIFLVIPRLYLNSKWHELKIEFVEPGPRPRGDDDEELEYHDLRAREYRRVAMLLNAGFFLLMGIVLTRQYGHNFLDLGGLISDYLSRLMPPSPGG